MADETNGNPNGSDDQARHDSAVKQEQVIIAADPNEIIDLLTDDENDNGQTSRLRENDTNLMHAAHTSVSAEPMDIPENEPEPTALDEPAGPSDDQVLALQRRLLQKYKEQQQDDDDDDAAKFQAAKKQYQAKKKAKTISIEEEIEFIKWESRESARLRKIEADREFDDRSQAGDSAGSEGLFVSDREVPPPPFENSDDEPAPKKRGRKRAQAAEEDDAPPPKKRAGPKGATAKKKKVAGTNYHEEDINAIIDKARSARGKKQTKGAKVPVPKKGKAKSANRHDPSMTNLTSIFGTDVFGDTAKTAGLANQPTFQQDRGRRDKALKDLIASVPEESAAVAKGDKRFLDNAIKDFTGQGSVSPAEGGLWHVKGMKTTLKHYQILGIAFMRRRENDLRQPRGGILADEMGLGKTLMMLANVVNGKPPSDKTRPKATLIVASPSLVMQWMEEIRMHCQTRRESKHGIGTVIQHRAGARINSNETAELLESADIVLTTYSEVLRSYPSMKNMPPNLITAAQKQEYWLEKWEKERGVLHRLKFLRVVLDEAQAIKNHQSRTSLACRALEGRHFWAITGTPILNTVREFYPYFKFLREPATGSYKLFRENFCTPEDTAGKERLNVFLRKFMIRRTHLDKLFNARLLDLPTPRQHTLWVEFNEVERQVYTIIKSRFVQQINKMSAAGGIAKRFSSIWAMIIRLRQICAHSLLVFESCVDLLQREDFEKLNKITMHENENADEGRALLIHLRNVLNSGLASGTIEGGISGSVLTENETLATGVVDIDDTEGDVGGKHGLAFRFQKVLNAVRESSKWEEIKARAECCGCRQPPDTPYVTSCDHIYCLTCLRDLQHLSARRGYDQARCSECGEAYVSSRPCEEGLEALQARATSTSDAQPAKKAPRGTKKDEGLDLLSMKGEILPSAKTIAAKGQIMQWIKEDPDVKIIVYSQWLPFLRILGKVCQTEGWRAEHYNGQMTHEAREKTIHDFTHSPDIKILLASFRAGGLGLNITAASRVILIDPWWNQALEQQAFCRVFRIGQEKETRMTRIVVKNTVDVAMMQMKERKLLEIQEVMDSAKLQEKLSVEDLMRLFGKVEADEDGKPFIFADETYEPDHLRLVENDSDDEEGFMGNEE